MGGVDRDTELQLFGLQRPLADGDLQRLSGNGSYTATITVTDGSGPTATRKRSSDSGLSYIYVTDEGRTAVTRSGFMSNHDGKVIDGASGRDRRVYPGGGSLGARIFPISP